jgi:hypothetical protein
MRIPLSLVTLIVCLSSTDAFAQMSWPSPTARVQGWHADLDSTLSSFLRRDRSFSPEARMNFARDVRRLRDSTASWSDERMIVELAKAVAGAHNAHTRLYLLRNRQVLRRYPIRVWWFGDDLYVVRTHPEQADLLGAKIAAIAGHPVAEVAALVAPLYTANRSWARYLSTYLLMSPEILKGVGVLDGEGAVALKVETRDREKRVFNVPPMPLERSDQPFEASWDLAPTHPGRQGPWVSVLRDTTRLPLYLRHLSTFYWMQRIPESKVLYFQYNRASDQPNGETVVAFGDRLMAELKRDAPQKLVIDLRFNTGGNLQLADSLFKQIAALPWAKERGRIFVITGRGTFSAGITAVASLREWTSAVLVGEPVGDGLDTWSEGGNILLPNTKLTLHYADGFHSLSPIEHPENKPYQYDLSVTSLDPDIAVETTFAQYLANDDPAMDAVLTFRK